MSKRNINYVKPQDPSFLAKLKANIGYIEGPTVDAKLPKLSSEDLEHSDSEDSPLHRSDELPQIIVLKEGDLTADQVQSERKRLQKEKLEAKADLSKPIVFCKHNKSSKKDIIDKLKGEGGEKKIRQTKIASGTTSKQPAITNKLSFTFDDTEN